MKEQNIINQKRTFEKVPKSPAAQKIQQTKKDANSWWE